MLRKPNFLRVLYQDAKPHMFEKILLKYRANLNNSALEGCVQVRRDKYNVNDLPFRNYNYLQALNRNCENIVGFTRIPTGIIGPFNDKHIPFATTEGALISSINRGYKLLNKCNTNLVVEDVGMTRSPIVKCASLNDVQTLKNWIKKNYDLLKQKFETNTLYTKLQNVEFLQEGRHLHIRFCATTGDAMGMNMISKASNNVLKYLQTKFNINIVSLSGNTCTDKKASAINLIRGRGKNAIMDALIKKNDLHNILKVTPDQLIQLNIQKNLIGSSLAGTLGGNNCNAANVIAGLFIALGQDCGQIGTSSYCMINMTKEKDDLLVTINMPSLELGTIGGGTILDDQFNNLKLLGIKQDNLPGENVKILTKVVIYSVLSCELSLMASLCNNDLVGAHLRLNRGVK